MPVQIQFRRGTAAQWTAANVTLAEGELGLETDTSLMKIGDGDTPWNSLAYAVINGTVADGLITEAKLASNAVTEAKIANNAVTQTKLASTLSGVTVCTSTTRPGSPFTGQTIYETNTALFRTWNGTAWVTIGPATPTPQYPEQSAYGVATGGTSSSITVNSINYTLLTFTTTANLTVSTQGWFDFILVGGGGSGGAGLNSGAWSYGNWAAGGGGGGEVRFFAMPVLAGTYSITIGAGGASNGLQGDSTRITNLGLCAMGGGGGSGTSGVPYSPQYGGGCGGGSGGWHQGVGMGFKGAASSPSSFGGGGGGAGGAGSSSTGGAGFDVSVWIGGATANRGAGGNGGTNTGAGAAGTANTGNGGVGGGFATSSAGGAGGSGIAYVRFRV